MYTLASFSSSCLGACGSHDQDDGRHAGPQLLFLSPDRVVVHDRNNHSKPPIKSHTASSTNGAAVDIAFCLARGGLCASPTQHIGACRPEFVPVVLGGPLHGRALLGRRLRGPQQHRRSRSFRQANSCSVSVWCRRAHCARLPARRTRGPSEPLSLAPIILRCVRGAEIQQDQERVWADGVVQCCAAERLAALVVLAGYGPATILWYLPSMDRRSH